MILLLPKQNKYKTRKKAIGNIENTEYEYMKTKGIILSAGAIHALKNADYARGQWHYIPPC